jgi:hypothetical protein
LKTRFSELFRRNCWMSFEPVEGSLSVLADDIGPDKIMWTTDYLHSLSRWVIVSAAVKHSTARPKVTGSRLQQACAQ